MLSGCNDFLFFFLLFVIVCCLMCSSPSHPNTFPLPSELLPPPCLYFSTTVTVHYTMKCFVRSSQHHHLYHIYALHSNFSNLMSYSWCFIHFNHLGLVSFTVGGILQKTYRRETWPILSGVTKCCRNCLQKRKGSKVLQRDLPRCFISFC